MAIKYQTRKNKDGTVTYFTRVELPRNLETNERRREPIAAKSLDELENRYHEVLTASNAGAHVLRRETITVAELCAKWLPHYKGKVELSTWSFADLTVARSILPRLARIKLRDLSALDIAEWYQWLADEQGLGTGSIARRRSVLSTALSTAIEWGLVGVNVVEKVKPPKITRRAVRYLTEDEARELVKIAAGKPCEGFIVLALGTGMRLAELIALQWPQVNLVSGRITIKRALGEAGNSRRYDKKPKTDAGRRTIAIAPDLVAYLTARKVEDERRRAHERGWNAKRLVLPGETGDYQWPSNIRRSLRQQAKLAGLPVDLRPHELRHTHAALQIRAGTPMKAIQHRLGHASIKVTMDLYGFIYDDVAEAAAGALPGLVPAAFLLPPKIVDLSTRLALPENGAHAGHMAGVDVVEAAEG